MQTQVEAVDHSRGSVPDSRVRSRHPSTLPFWPEGSPFGAERELCPKAQAFGSKPSLQKRSVEAIADVIGGAHRFCVRRGVATAMASVGRNRVEFELNGEAVAVEGPDPRASLGEYLRSERGLSGLQLACRQGGCGACTVLLSGLEAQDGEFDHRPVNSCLVPLCSVDGKKVTTVEGVGSVKAGLHPVQSAIVDFHGTQCGFCTPGMVRFLQNLR